MDKKEKLQNIEEKVTQLTQKRKELFNEWAYLIKKNERLYELDNEYDPEITKQVDKLLKEQKSISKKIMKLLEQADNFIIDE